MTTVNISRRKFVISSVAAGAGLSLGLSLPVTSKFAIADDHGGAPEVNAWVVIDADDTVTVRIARSEMGQGTLTGLAQLVAEELECDWDKVTWEYPTPGENLKRDRVWQSFATGGSRGVRGSNEYVRQGGAAARLMLVEAAAQEWSVPVAECSARRVLSPTAQQARRRPTAQLPGRRQNLHLRCKLHSKIQKTGS